VTLFGIPVITPLLRWSSVPCTHDGHLHYHRVVAIKHAWQNGLLFSRWLPDLAFGYGYPFFLYREPLPLYLTHFLHLAGLPLPAATNLFYILCLLAAGYFMFLWVRDVFGAPAALVSAVAYMAAPYQLADVLVRGNQVESMALALFPLLLGSGRRFVLGGRARWFLLSALGLAALALSHNISLLLFTPTLGLYLLALALLQRMDWRQAALRLGLIFLVGLGLTAFYTGPALLEMDEVTLSLSTTTRNNDFRYNFASPGEIFGAVTPEDPTLINPPLPFRLGWAPAGLALLGLLSLARNRDREQRAHILLMAAGALLLLFFALPLSRWLWEALPLIEFVQFPWRFVGRAALPVAMLAGAPFALLNHGESMAGARRYLLPALAIAISLLLLEAFPLLYPNYCREEPYPTILAVHEYEHQTGLVGVDPEGSYFPTTVEQRPNGSPLEAAYVAGQRPQRFDESAMPQGAVVLEEQYEPNEARLVVETPQAFEARYLTFAFPGWRVRVDGQDVTVTSSDPLGLMSFTVPAGQHTIEVDWTSTPLRTAFGVLSAAAALLLVAAAYWLRRRSDESYGPEPQAAAPPRRSSLPHLAPLLLLALLLTGAKLLMDRVETPLRRAAAPAVEYATSLEAGELRLAGFNLNRGTVPSGATFDVDLAWQTEAVPAAAYQSNVWLRGPQGLVWSDRDTFRTRLYEDAPTTEAWQPGQWAWDSREVQVLPGTPPGRYELVLTLFRLDDLQPLTLVENGAAAGPTAVIAEIEVTEPETVAQFEPQVVTNKVMSGLQLLGYNLDRAQAAPGDPVLLTLFWEKVGSDRGAAQLPLALLNESGEPVREWQIAPVRNDFPPQQWQEGERWRGQHLLRLPAALESGTYRLELGETALGEVQIEAPDRTFEEPTYQQAVAAEFGGLAQLSGYTIEPPHGLQDAPAGPLTLTLVWQGLSEMEVSYRVFVHLLDTQGQIVAQSDAEPAQWARPTTGWAPGEYVIDRHVLQVPQGAEGPLTLRVGLYEAESGERLPVNGTDHVLLP
jgi:hypothetical protein